jgi:hypothetical protein
MSKLVNFFAVYVETGSSATATTLAFAIGALAATRTWKVIHDE